MRPAARRLAIAVTLAACGGGGGSPGPDADPGPPDPQFWEPTARSVAIAESAWLGRDPIGSIAASFVTGLTNDYTEAMRAGNCRLLTSTAAYCPGECDGWCVDTECHEFPVAQSAGTITTTGLSRAVTLTYNSGYYASQPDPLPAELFDAGDPVGITAAGADVPGFSLAATGVDGVSPDLTGPCDNEWHLTRGQDAVLHWNRVAGSRVHLRIPSPNRGHGLPSIAVIECEGPDEGQAVIPAAFVAAMPDFQEIQGCDGIACVGNDCPPASIARYTAATTTAGGETVVLRVESTASFLVYDN